MISDDVKFHDIANLFPMMTKDELTGLKSDIKANGQIEPIWIHDGQIIDGRNRYLACKDLGIEPVTREYHGDGPLVDFVISLNVQRRHLTAGQKAFVALDLIGYYEDAAKERMLAGKKNPKETVPQGQARDMAGKAVGVSGRSVSTARKIRKYASWHEDMVKRGETTFAEAKKVADVLANYREWLQTLSKEDWVKEITTLIKKVAKKNGWSISELIAKLKEREEQA